LARRSNGSRHALVVHNPTAGGGRWPKTKVDATLGANDDRHISYVSTKHPGWRARMHAATGDGVDVVVLIGGDGTVRKVVTELAGTLTPIRIIPAGTANNFARSLGITTPLQPGDDAGWVVDRPDGLVDVDVPVLQGELSGRFIESVGGGLFARLLTEAERAESADTRSGRLADGLRQLLDLSRICPATPWRLRLDGREISGRFWGVEVLNIGAVGPRVPLAPQAHPGDGRLDCVLLREEHRDPVIGYLTAALARSDSRQPRPAVDAIDVPVRRCRTVTAECPAGTLLHIDDRSFEADGPARWMASCDGATVRVAAPERDGESRSGGDR